MDNVTDLDEYRSRGGSTRPPIVREKDGSVILAVLAQVTELSPEDARRLGEHLVDTANLIEDGL